MRLPWPGAERLRGGPRAICVRRQGSAGSHNAQGQGRGTPQGGEAQESQGAAVERSANGGPNRQRDETPEARPLSAEMPHAPKARQAPLIREGPDLSVRAEEPIPADGQSWGGANAVGSGLLDAARLLIARGDVTSKEGDDLC